MKLRQDVYNTYWQTAAERQNIFFRKLRGDQYPLTEDPIYQTYKFCNVYRASDRVSQYLIKDVIYSSTFSSENILFRTILFRLLNKIKTWQALEGRIGEVSLETFNIDYYDEALSSLKDSLGVIYGNAFILCANKAFGFPRKHQNHLALLNLIFKSTNTPKVLLESKTLEQLFTNLKELPLIGNFMAYQLAIDLNYSELFNFNENDFTIAGPGALRGIEKCFIDTDRKGNAYIIQYIVDN